MHLLPVSVLVGLASVPISGVVAGDLHQLAKAAGKLYFGTAIDNSELTDTAYNSIVADANEFGQITPGNTQKWQFTETSQGTFSFEKGDVIADFAKANGQIMRCHTLVWHSQLPSWVSSGTWTTETLTAVINTHIENEVGHYAGQCYAWDVVNEALADDASYRDSIFYQVLGTDFLPIAFKAAAAADADAKLYYNDYNIEYSGAKQKAALAIVDIIQAAGAPIHGVGLQGHFIVGSMPSQSDMTAVLEAYVAKGLEVAYTEVDIRFSSLPSTESGLAQQATDYASVVGACLDVEACVGITVWGASDKYSWIPNTFSGQGDACLLTSDFATKPAYDTVREVLAAAAGTGAGTGSSNSSTSSSSAVGSSSAATATTSSSASSTHRSSSADAGSTSTSPSTAPTAVRSASSPITTLATSARTSGRSSVPTTTAATTGRQQCNKRKARRARLSVQ